MLFKNANIFVNGKFQYGAFRVENGKFAEILDTVPGKRGLIWRASGLSTV